VLAAVHGFLGAKRERLRLDITNLGFDHERHTRLLILLDVNFIV
jgi:hypothetical protein